MSFMAHGTSHGVYYTEGWHVEPGTTNATKKWYEATGWNGRRVVPSLNCAKCGYLWSPRVIEPKECPACKSRNWKG